MKKKVETAKDGRQFVRVDEFVASSLNGITTKLYILSSDDSHYYQVDVDATGSGTVAITDVGTTAPTDGLIVIGG